MSLASSLPLVGPLANAYPTTVNIIAGLVGVITLTLLYLYPYRSYTLSFKNIPGPAPTSFLWGNIKDIIAAGPGELHKEWIKQYGPTIRYRLVIGTNRLFSADVGFLQYVLQHSDDFPKPPRTSRVLARMLGNGLLSAEADVHRRQRRVINPAFSPAAIREMADIFWDKAYELTNKLTMFVDRDESMFTEQPSLTPPAPGDEAKGGRKIDMMKYLGQMALDIIGEAGFGYSFEALSHERNELADNFMAMFSASTRVTPFAVLQNFVPILRVVPTKTNKLVDKSHKATARLAREIVERKKRELASEYADGFEKGQDVGKDLLSILLKANMNPSLRPDQKLTDEDVVAQICTFMLAGNETSSTGLTWLLYRLSLHPEIQQRLREECLNVSSERPSVEEISAMPYMDKVVHESLRLDGPVPGTMRMASKDDVIPLSTPVVGRDGKMVDSVQVKKGMEIFIPIIAVNHSPDIWGPDADQFNPDRFDRAGLPTQNVPGTWGNLLSFLGGARNCIGYRFALIEMKITLFVLIRAFQFDELPSKPVIEQKSSIVMRPRVKGEESVGLQLPLLVRALD